VPASLLKSVAHYLDGQDQVNKTIWPTLFALRRLRIAVRGAVDRGNAETHSVAGAIAEGADVPFNLDVVKFEKSFSLDDQELLIGQMALMTLTSYFEGACETAAADLGWASHKFLMFPPTATSWRTGQRLRGHWSEMRAGGSALIETCYGPRSRARTHYAESRLPAVLQGFRYWKEVRNALVHAGGRANDALVDAQRAYAPVTNTDLGLRAKVMLTRDGGLEPNPGSAKLLTVGDRFAVSPYAAFNAADIMNKAMITYDFLLCRTSSGERLLLDRLLSEAHPKRWGDPDYRQPSLVRSLSNRAKAPIPDRPDLMLRALERRRASR